MIQSTMTEKRSILSVMGEQEEPIFRNFICSYNNRGKFSKHQK